MTVCDTCGVLVSTTGYLGGSIVCHECARATRKGDTERIEKRIARYGGDQ